MTPAALVNGQPLDERWSLQRGLHYGDGVFRTCLIHRGAVVTLAEQLAKLHGDAERLRLRVADAAALRADCERLARAQDAGVLKVMLTRAAAERGYRTTSERADALVFRYPLPEYPADTWEHGVRARRAGFRLATQPRLAGIKHLNRLEQVLAARHCADAQEAIVEDEQGRPVGGTRSNLFWVAGGAVQTPALEHCGVAGLMRERVLAAAARLGVATRVAAGSWEDLGGADEAFVTNSIVGICPLRSLGAREWRAPGPVTARLMAALDHPRPAAA